MTHKEKAKELYNKFYNTDSHGNSVKVRESLAKQCALIAVDEILEELEYRKQIIDDYDYLFDWDNIVIGFWQEVKQEIEKL